MPDSIRPDPDALLENARSQEYRHSRGRLKIFLGMAAGSGKTYTMLQEAHKLAAAGVDLVVGYVELHGRAETEALLPGLAALPPLELEHRGLRLREFDLDGALARAPAVIISARG